MTTALLVPCYNAERFLVRLREQVERLKPAFAEVLLADDGSSDETAAQAESMGFRVLRLGRNLGPGGARNALARATQAEWIHFHDVDDEIAPDYVAQIRPVLSDALDAVFHFTDFIDEETRAPIIRWQFDPARLSADPARTLLRSPLPTMSSILRRSAFLAVGGFDEQLRCFEDGDLHFRLALGGARIVGLPLVLEFSLRHGAGAGSNQHYCFKCRLEFLERYASSVDASLRESVALEAERTAVELLRHGDRLNADRAVRLGSRLGLRIPSTAHPLLRMLRLVMPPTLLLAAQTRLRSTRKNSHG